MYELWIIVTVALSAKLIFNLNAIPVQNGLILTSALCKMKTASTSNTSIYQCLFISIIIKNVIKIAREIIVFGNSL